MAEEKNLTSNTDLMAEIIPIAKALSADLLKFASSNPGGRAIILDLATSTGSTASVLETFSELISKYGSCDEKVESKIIPLVCHSLKIKIESIKTALDETLKNESDEEWVMGNSVVKNDPTRRRVIDSRQEAFGAELGGVLKMNRLVMTFEETNETMAFLMNALKYVALKKKEEEKTIEDSEKRELDKIMETFPANYLKGWKTSIQEMVEQSKESEIDLDRDGLLPLNRRRPCHDDAISIVSWDSFASNQFVESKELYEYWVFQKIHGENRTIKGWSFLGFSSREFVDNTTHSLEGKAKPQEEMKAKDEETRSEAQYHTREASINRSIAALPQRFQTELNHLLEDRERQSCNFRFVREWSVIDIQPLKPRIKTPARTWSAWWKGEGGIQQWGLILKGETKARFGNQQSDKERLDARIPDRWNDGFRKNPYRPVIDRDVQRREYYDDEPVDRVAIMPRGAVPRYRSPMRRPVNPPAPSPEEYEKQLKDLLKNVTNPEVKVPLKDEGW